MNKSLLLMGIIALVGIAQPVLADQCAYVEREQALSAISRLKVGRSVYFLCEPCGETQLRPEIIQSLSVGTVDYENYWQVNINGKGIDLAYTYVASGSENQLVNLAIASNCPVTDVSPILPRNRKRFSD